LSWWEQVRHLIQHVCLHAVIRAVTAASSSSSLTASLYLRSHTVNRSGCARSATPVLRTMTMSSEPRSQEVISYTMSRIRSKDTTIEVRLRRALWKRGLRYRKHYKKVAGCPDIVFISAKVAIFCDSTFWHGRDWGQRKVKLKSNREYWIKKIEGNMKRDERVRQELRDKDWLVISFWDIEIDNDLEGCVNKIINALSLRLSKAL